MVNGPPCPNCGFALRWIAEQNAWGCDRCRSIHAPQAIQSSPAGQAPTTPGGPATMPSPQPPATGGGAKTVMAFGAPPWTASGAGASPAGPLPGYGPAAPGSFAGGNARTPSVAPGSYPPGAAAPYTPTPAAAAPMSQPSVSPYAPPQSPQGGQPGPQGGHPGPYGGPPGPYGGPPGPYGGQPGPYGGQPGPYGGQPGPYGGQPGPHGGPPGPPSSAAPAHAVAPGGGKSKKGLWIAIAGVVVVAGATVAIVLATRGGGGASGGIASKDELAKQTLAALAKGDADALLALTGPEDLEQQLVDCTKRDDGEVDDPKKEREELRDKLAKVATAAKDLKLELVKVDEKDRDTKEKGAKVSERCTLKQTASRVKLDARIKVAKGDKPATEQSVEIRVLEVDGRWYLRRAPEISAGADCASAVAHSIALGKDKIKGAGLGESAIGRLEKQMTAHCTDDVWPDDAIECFATSVSDDASERCLKMLSNSQRDKLMAAMSDVIAQELKNNAPPTPPPVPPAAIDAGTSGGDPLPPEEPPAGGTTTADGAGVQLPPICNEYKEQILKLQSCSKLPASTRKQMLESYEIIVKSWNDIKTKTPALADSMGQACKSGVDSAIELRKLCR